MRNRFFEVDLQIKPVCVASRAMWVCIAIFRRNFESSGDAGANMKCQVALHLHLTLQSSFASGDFWQCKSALALNGKI